MKSQTEPGAPTPEDVLNELRALITEAKTILGDEPLSGCADVKRKVTEGARQADESIRSNPYQALLVAAGVGLIAGMLLNRRSRE